MEKNDNPLSTRKSGR